MRHTRKSAKKNSKSLTMRKKSMPRRKIFKQRGGGIKEIAQAFIDRFKSDDTFAEKIITEFNEKGREYWGNRYISPYNEKEGITEEVLEDSRSGLETYTKSKFKAQIIEDQGCEEDELEDDELETSFDDSYRHAVVIDMADPMSPTVISLKDSKFEEMVEDYIFTWDGIDKLSKQYPTMFVLTGSTPGQLTFYIPLPTE